MSTWGSTELLLPQWDFPWQPKMFLRAHISILDFWLPKQSVQDLSTPIPSNKFPLKAMGLVRDRNFLGSQVQLLEWGWGEGESSKQLELTGQGGVTSQGKWVHW